MLIIFGNPKGYDLCGIDISNSDEVIRVPHIIGTGTALVGNDMSLGGLYDTTIYQWITMSAFVKMILLC